MDPSLRATILSIMKDSMEYSSAPAMLLLYDDRLVAYLSNASSPLTLQDSDLILLASFVSNSNSLKSHEQNWVPVCLPAFNANAHLQAYIANFSFNRSGPASTSTLSLVMISSDSDPEKFRILHIVRSDIQGRLSAPELAERLYKSISEESTRLNRYKTSFLAIHFFFKCTPISKESVACGSTSPAQYISTSWSTAYSTEGRERVWAGYFSNAVRMRCGSCTTESSLMQSSVLEQTKSTVPDLNSLEKTKFSRRQGSFVASSREISHVIVHDNKSSDQSDGENLLTFYPLPSHSLVYTCTTNEIIIGLASIDSELHVTFPSCLDPLDACNLANSLFQTLRGDINILLQTNIPT